MKAKTTIANAMDGQTKTYYILAEDGRTVPGIRISVEYSNLVPVEVADAAMEGYMLLQSTVNKALMDKGCMESEE